MVEHIKELPDFRETYDLYEGRRLDEPDKEVPIEKLEIADKQAFQTAVNKFAEDVYGNYKGAKENDPKAKTRIFEEEQMTKTTVPLGEMVVDSSIPISVDVYKNFTNERGKKTESINFYFYKGTGEDQDFIANISIADRGENGLDVVDRLVDPKFRKQGLGTMLFKCADAFIQRVSTERQKPVNSFAKMSQLDVISQFWKNGYRPETEEDWQRLEMVLNGHEDLELAERFFVFRKDTPDKDRYFTDPNGEFYLNADGQRVINYNNAFRIKMVKRFEAELSDSITDVRESVTEKIESIESRE